MKAVSLYHPMDVGRTIDNIDRFMESFFGPDGGTVSNRVAGALGRIPPVDVIEKDDAYILEAELPGFDEGDINLSLDGGMISIESKKEEATEEKDGERYVVRERSRASFSRTFRLPENADPESIKAAFKNGLLRLEIKKRTEAQKKVIQITKG